jgi:membrane protein required for colicin V production
MLDVIIIVMLLVCAVVGFFKGFVREIISLAGVIFGFLGASYFSYIVGNWLNFNSEYAGILYFIITFVLICLVFFIIAKITKKVIANIGLGCLDKLLGFLVGLLKGVLVIGALLYLIGILDIEKKFLKEENIEKSILYVPVTKTSAIIFPHLQKIYKKCEKNLVN